MVKFAYSPVPTKIKAYFDKIQEVSVPPRVNSEYVKSIGFKSSNDYYLISILKFLGFVDPSNVPTDRWKRYRAKAEAKKVMAEALKSSYGVLFKTYEDAFRKDKQTLRDFFTSKTKLGSATIELMVRTFTQLCNLADFEAPARARPFKSKNARAQRNTLIDNYSTTQSYIGGEARGGFVQKSRYGGSKKLRLAFFICLCCARFFS